MRLTTDDVVWALNRASDAVRREGREAMEDVDLGDRTFSEVADGLDNLALRIVAVGRLLVPSKGGTTLTLTNVLPPPPTGTFPPATRKPGPMVSVWPECLECGAALYPGQAHPGQTTVHAIGCSFETVKPARTFDPVSVAVDNAGTRDEAGELLAKIAPQFSRIDVKTQGFLRGMRDKLLQEAAWQPSDKQMDWLRVLAEGRRRERPRR